MQAEREQKQKPKGRNRNRNEAGKAKIGTNRKIRKDKERKDNWSQDRATKKSSYKEHRVDALAPYAEEGRGKLRKATGSGKQA